LELLENIKCFILDTLFPITCLSCGKKDIWLCEECLKKIEFLPAQTCPKCEKKTTEKGMLCQNCRPFSLDGMIVASRYKTANLGKIIHLYKYRFIQDLCVPLGKIISEAVIRNDLPIPDIIIPVPLHPKRLRWRGFNQAELLAEQISKNMVAGFEIQVRPDLMERQRFTKPQMKITSYSGRQENIQGAFFLKSRATGGLDLKGKTVLLIDDIATTGATLFGCAAVLKRSGAKKVMAAVIARQEM